MLSLSSLAGGAARPHPSSCRAFLPFLLWVGLVRLLFLWRGAPHTAWIDFVIEFKKRMKLLLEEGTHHSKGWGGEGSTTQNDEVKAPPFQGGEEGITTQRTRRATPKGGGTKASPPDRRREWESSTTHKGEGQTAAPPKKGGAKERHLPKGGETTAPAPSSIPDPHTLIFRFNRINN